MVQVLYASVGESSLMDGDSPSVDVQEGCPSAIIMIII